MYAWFGLPGGGGAAARRCAQFLSRPPAPHGKPNASAATTIQIDAFCGSGGGRGVSPQASFGLPTRPKGQWCSKPNTTACLASAPALPHPSGKKPLDVVQHYLVVVGFHESDAIERSSCSSNRGWRRVREGEMVKVVENTGKLVHLILPARPPDELSEEALEEVVPPALCDQYGPPSIFRSPPALSGTPRHQCGPPRG